MGHEASQERVSCPYCGSDDPVAWAEERGFKTVRCSACRLLYVNPRPSLGSIDAAVRTGKHTDQADGLNVVARRVGKKVRRYEIVLRRAFDDVWNSGAPIAWLDVGAGYGEVMEAVSRLCAPESRVAGLEPMHPKAEFARSRGLDVAEAYLGSWHRGEVDIISAVDVFSHVPDFHSFLRDARSVLAAGGELFIETGNLADLEHREDFPGELGLPDHLVFAGESQLRGYLAEAGFSVVRIERQRVDHLLYCTKNVVKALLGRPANIRLPYTSAYRQLLIRARLDTTPR